MDVRAEISYPGASLDDVVGLAFDPDFRAAVCQATGAVDHDVTMQEHAGSTVVTVTRTMPADVPDFVRKFVGETLTIEQTETWFPDQGSGDRRADVSLKIVGQPASMSGSLLLNETTEGVLEIIEGDLRVSVPFIGKKIEAEIAKGILAAARKEQETGRAWLTSSP